MEFSSILDDMAITIMVGSPKIFLKVMPKFYRIVDRCNAICNPYAEVRVHMCVGLNAHYWLRCLI